MALFGQSPDSAARAEAVARAQKWAVALDRGTLPDFVEHRLAEAASGRTPWLSTMTPAELLAARRHGIHPIATVSGTCWYHYGYSWTNGHAEGWHAALERMKQEAAAAGANAILDVQMRTIKLAVGASMDFTVIGTAVNIDVFPHGRDPIIATVSTQEFVRLLEAGIIPTGVAIGAHYEWLTTSRYANPTGNVWNGNMHLPELSAFWEQVRQKAHADLRADTRRSGNGVLAHTHFGQLIKKEGGEQQPPMFLGRHIVIGTVVQVEPKEGVPHDITPVIDMRDDLSPLSNRKDRAHTAYSLDSEEDGAI